VGVLVAILLVIGVNLSVFTEAPALPGLLIWIFIALLLAYIPIREILKE